MTDPDTLTPVHTAAIQFAAAGCSVVPARADGSKAPVGDWKRWQTERADRAQIDAWFAAGHPGMGVVCGAASGGLIMLEFEGRAIADKLDVRAAEIAMGAGDADLWRRILAGYTELTPSGGVHILYRITDAPTPGNQKLARRPNSGSTGVEILAETRGEGGYVVVAPSHGPTHPTGKPWVQLSGSPTTIPNLTIDEHNRVCSILRTLDNMPAPEAVADTKSAISRVGDEATPGDDYNGRHTWNDVLAPDGWTAVRTRGQIVDWCRPGKTGAVSATTGYGEHDLLYVFTTSTLFDSERSYSKFAAYALIQHGGSFADAARQLRKEGYGAPRQVLEPLRPFMHTTPVPVGGNLPHTQPPDVTDAGRMAVEDAPPTGTSNKPGTPLEVSDVEHTTWWPRPLGDIIDGAEDDEADKPSVLARDDGHRILYAGKVNGLVGESESGKTWVALMACKQTLEVGGHVLYLDFEDTAKGIVTRLRTLGVDDKALGGLTYISPDESFHDLAKADLAAAHRDAGPVLVVVDGFNAAMTLLGLELKDNTDITKFFITFLRPLRDRDAAVLTVDHVTKNKEARGDYAIGGQAKRAMTDGSYIGVEALKPFGRGQSGILKLTSIKDRPGFVRAISAGAKNIGQLEVTDCGDKMKMRIKAPDMRPASERGPFRPTRIMEKVSRLLEVIPGSQLSQSAIEKTDGIGKAEHVRAALGRLIDEGYVKSEAGPRNSHLHESIKPYREADDVHLTAWSHDDD